MLLVIDVGNTNIVLGVYDKTELVGHWRISTDRVRTTDEYGMLMMNLFFHDRKVDVKDIGDPSVVAEDWYSFERNDELARKVFKACENEMYIRRCAALINSLNSLKSDHNIAEKRN